MKRQLKQLVEWEMSKIWARRERERNGREKGEKKTNKLDLWRPKFGFTQRLLIIVSLSSPIAAKSLEFSLSFIHEIFNSSSIRRTGAKRANEKSWKLSKQHELEWISLSENNNNNLIWQERYERTRDVRRVKSWTVWNCLWPGLRIILFRSAR